MIAHSRRAHLYGSHMLPQVERPLAVQPRPHKVSRPRAPTIVSWPDC